MNASKNMFYFLNWELISPISNPFDLTHGDEVIEISIQDVDRCQPVGHYTIPIVQAGQSFSALRVNLLYQKNLLPETFKNICVSIRILRGLEQRVIYANDLVLPAPYYMDRQVVRIPIHRLWYYDDYFRMVLTNFYP